MKYLDENLPLCYIMLEALVQRGDFFALKEQTKRREPPECGNADLCGRGGDHTLSEALLYVSGVWRVRGCKKAVHR